MKKENAEFIVYNYIKRAIIAKQLMPNEQIVEQSLVEKLGVSRTPIRAALKKLSYEGMLEIKPNKGAFVVKPSYEEVRDVFESKFLIEIEVIKLACENITEDELKELDALQLKSNELYLKNDYGNFIDLNYHFHMVLARGSKNKVYEKQVSELMNLSNIQILLYDDFRKADIEGMSSIDEHQQIISALKNKNVDICVKSIYYHLQKTYEALNIPLPLRLKSNVKI